MFGISRGGGILSDLERSEVMWSLCGPYFFGIFTFFVRTLLSLDYFIYFGSSVLNPGVVFLFFHRGFSPLYSPCGLL